MLQTPVSTTKRLIVLRRSWLARAGEGRHRVQTSLASRTLNFRPPPFSLYQNAKYQAVTKDISSTSEEKRTKNFATLQVGIAANALG